MPSDMNVTGDRQKSLPQVRHRKSLKFLLVQRRRNCCHRHSFAEYRRVLPQRSSFPVAGRDGAVVAYGPDFADIYRRAGSGAHVVKMQILNLQRFTDLRYRARDRLLRHWQRRRRKHIPVVRALSQRPIEQSARLPAHIDDLLPPGLHAPLGDDAPGFRNIAADGPHAVIELVAPRSRNLTATQAGQDSELDDELVEVDLSAKIPPGETGHTRPVSTTTTKPSLIGARSQSRWLAAQPDPDPFHTRTEHPRSWKNSRSAICLALFSRPAIRLASIVVSLCGTASGPNLAFRLA